MFRIRHSVREVDLGLPQLLRRSSLWHQLILKTANKCVKELYLRCYDEKSTISNVFRTQIWKRRLGGCFWKVLSHFSWSKYFRFLHQLSCNKKFIECNCRPLIQCLFNLLTSILNRGGSRTPVGTKIDFFHKEHHPRWYKCPRSASVNITI